MTTIEKLLTKTRAAADQRQAAARGRYVELVKSAGRGDDKIDPDALVEFLDAAGFSVDEFQQDVERYASRLALKADADALPTLQKKLTSLKAGIAKAEGERDAAFAAAEAKYVAAAEPLFDQVRDLDAAIAKGSAAGAKLIATAGRDLIATRDDAQRTLAAAQNAFETRRADVHQIRLQIEEQRAIIADPKKKVGGNGGVWGHGEFLKAMAEVKRVAEAKLIELEKLLGKRERMAGELAAKVEVASAALARAEAVLLIP